MGSSYTRRSAEPPRRFVARISLNIDGHDIRCFGRQLQARSSDDDMTGANMFRHPAPVTGAFDNIQSMTESFRE